MKAESETKTMTDRAHAPVLVPVADLLEWHDQAVEEWHRDRRQAESQLGDARQAARHFARSMELDPAVDNPSRQALRVIRAPSAGASLDP